MNKKEGGISVSKMVTLGRTGIEVNKDGFGALPIQRISLKESTKILKKAYNSGINFFDTARFYTDSEEKIGHALSEVRDKIYIATKTAAQNSEDFRNDLNISLKMLKTEYIDIYQFHNPGFCPKPGDGTGLYEAMLEAKGKGLIRHIGITNHRLAVAMEAADSGLYETVQFPFSYLATSEEAKLVEHCKKLNIGFIAMKALAGGLIKSSRAAYAYISQFDNVVPIWGIQKEEELDEILSCMKNPPEMDERLSAAIEQDRKELGKDFCRGCGYCQPCPAGIDIPTSARMSLMIRRAPLSVYMNEEWREKMKKIDDCIHCNHCKEHCPYGLDTPKLLAENWEDYKTFL
ncbi:MAG: aldo/keto reductase [Clostridiaceae bacterium]|jgi:aryl-alcohol dehydrogenase-like predicted oxidoreductase|nr:aldo/keto reductase [Clostridiaceae bacterium]